MIEVREYTGADAEALFRLFAHWDREHAFDPRIFADSLDGILASPDEAILLGLEDGELRGYAQMGRCRLLGFEPFCEIRQLLVDDTRRSRGIGKALVGRIEETAQAEGVRLVRLSSQVQRSRAHVFYERLGFVLIKVSKFYEKRLA